MSYFSTYSSCFATHFLHLSTSLRMPSRKKLDLLFHCLTCHANWSPTPVFITDILSSVLKSFHPFINSPITQKTVSILNLHSSVDFRRFHTLWPQKKEQCFVALPRCKLTVERPCFTAYCAGSNCLIVTTPKWHIAKDLFCIPKKDFSMCILFHAL